MKALTKLSPKSDLLAEKEIEKCEYVSLNMNISFYWVKFRLARYQRKHQYIGIRINYLKKKSADLTCWEKMQFSSFLC